MAPAATCRHLVQLRSPSEAQAAISSYSYDVMKEDFGVALLDYMRFMAGWGLWGSGLGWAVQRSKELLPRMLVA